MNDKIYSLYKKLYEEHGVSPEAVKARDAKQQKLRFQHLVSLGEIKENDSILDVGCGSGELLDYLRKMNINGEYCGVDFLEEFISYGNEKYADDKKATFIKLNILEDQFQKNYDWVILSGVFNDLRDNSEDFFFSLIKKMYQACNKGLLFNSLSKFVDYEDEKLFYTYHDKVMKFCIENLSKYVQVKTNYQLKKDTIPFEYSMGIYRK